MATPTATARPPRRITGPPHRGGHITGARRACRGRRGGVGRACCPQPRPSPCGTRILCHRRYPAAAFCNCPLVSGGLFTLAGMHPSPPGDIPAGKSASRIEGRALWATLNASPAHPRRAAPTMARYPGIVQISSEPYRPLGRLDISAFPGVRNGDMVRSPPTAEATRGTGTSASRTVSLARPPSSRRLANPGCDTTPCPADSKVSSTPPLDLQTHGMSFSGPRPNAGGPGCCWSRC